MTLSLSEAITDPDLFLPIFGGDLSTFATWTAILAALEGRPLTDAQLATFTQLTGRTEAPTEPASEAWFIAGRRSAKTRHLALLAVWMAACRDYRGSLAPGERAVAAIIAPDKKQAKVAFRYVAAILKNVPALAEMVMRETAEAFELSNGASIEIHVASFRSVRGRSATASSASMKRHSSETRKVQSPTPSCTSQHYLGSPRSRAASSSARAAPGGSAGSRSTSSPSTGANQPAR